MTPKAHEQALKAAKHLAEAATGVEQSVSALSKAAEQLKESARHLLLAMNEINAGLKDQT